MTPQGHQPPPHLPLKPAAAMLEGNSARPGSSRDIEAIPARDRDGREARGGSNFWPQENRSWPARPPRASPFRSSGPNGAGRPRSPSPPRRDRDFDRDHWDRDRDPRDRDREREWSFGRERDPSRRMRPDDRPPFPPGRDRPFDRDWERDRDERRFREDRYRDERPLPSPRPRSRDRGDRGRPPSPPLRRGPRDGPRREDSYRPAVPGPGPSTMANSRPSPPRAPRSMRDSQSPLETTSALPSKTLPSSSGPQTSDLEEGEVVSPVRPLRYPGGDRERERDRERDRDRDWDRRWTSPQRDRDRGTWRREWGRSRPNSRPRSPGSPPFSARPHDDGWGSRRRGASSPRRGGSIGPSEAQHNGPRSDAGRSDSAPSRSRTPMSTSDIRSRENKPTRQSNELQLDMGSDIGQGGAAERKPSLSTVDTKPIIEPTPTTNGRLRSKSPLPETRSATAPGESSERDTVDIVTREAPPKVPVPEEEKPNIVHAAPEPQNEADGVCVSVSRIPEPTADDVAEQRTLDSENAQAEAPRSEITEATSVEPVPVEAPTLETEGTEPQESSTIAPPAKPTAQNAHSAEPTSVPTVEPLVGKEDLESENQAVESLKALIEAESAADDVVENGHDNSSAEPTGSTRIDDSAKASHPASTTAQALIHGDDDGDVNMDTSVQEIPAVTKVDSENADSTTGEKIAVSVVEEITLAPAGEAAETPVAAATETKTEHVEMASAEEQVIPEPAEQLAEATPVIEAVVTISQEKPKQSTIDIIAVTPEDVVMAESDPQRTKGSTETVPKVAEIGEPATETSTSASAEKTVTFLSPNPQAKVLSPPLDDGAVKVAATIAERRSVALPAREELPRASKVRVDVLPTPAESIHASTDAETEVDADDAASELSPEDVEDAKVVAAVKAAVCAPGVFRVDIDTIIDYNQKCAPTPSTRPPQDLETFSVDEMIKDVVAPLGKQKAVAQNVAALVAEEQAELTAKVAYLRKEYLELDSEWAEHRAFLDKLMEKRGPPPPDLYAIPGSILPAPTPGLPPATPIAEESFSSRSNRRRGAGDAVATEAEYQAILAGLADSAAKDPTHRAAKTAAAIPDMILTKERDLVFDDENARVDDPIAFYDFKGVGEPIWTEEEREKFLKRYLQTPKQFGRIADGLPNKSAGDCVLYYYRTKYENDYKSLLASRRGVKARRAVSKKKSSALLADIERQKPRSRDKEGGGSGAATPLGRRGRGGRAGSDMPATPSGEQPPSTLSRKRKTDIDKVDKEKGDTDDASATPSRADSEVPTSGKSKPRVPREPKTKKRPRVSSASGKDGIKADPNSREPPSNLMPSIPEPSVEGAPQQPPINGKAVSENGAPLIDPITNLMYDTGPLLPPVKRQKRRKVSDNAAVPDTAASPVDPNAPVAPAPEAKSRRSTTNSYWSVAEKNKFPELVRTHGTDFRAIADKLGNTKTVIQVRNHYNLTLEQLRAAGIVLPASTEVGVQQVKVNGISADSYSNEFPRIPQSQSSQQQQQQQQQQPQSQPPQLQHPHPHALSSRERYNAFPGAVVPPAERRTSQGDYPSEPRMAVFPPSPIRSASNLPTSSSAPPSNPPSRTMRISALLNDEPSKDVKPFDTQSVISDGTVDEREFDGVPPRPSPRPAPSSLRSEPIYGRAEYERRTRQPSFDAARRPSFGERPDDRYARAPSASSYTYAAAASQSQSWPRGREEPSPAQYYSHHRSPQPGQLPPVSSREAHHRGGQWEGQLPQLGVFPPTNGPPPLHHGHNHGHVQRHPNHEYPRQADWRYLSTSNGGPDGRGPSPQPQPGYSHHRRE